MFEGIAQWSGKAASDKSETYRTSGGIAAKKRINPDLCRNKWRGKIVRQARQFFLVLSDQYWFQDAWSFALKQLAKLQI